MFHWRISLELMFLLLLANFVRRFRLELMYMSLIVGIRSNLTHHHGFQLLSIVYRNHFLRFNKQNKSSDSTVKFRQASNRCKKVLEVAKLAVMIKQ